MSQNSVDQIISKLRRADEAGDGAIDFSRVLAVQRE